MWKGVARRFRGHQEEHLKRVLLKRRKSDIQKTPCPRLRCDRHRVPPPSTVSGAALFPSAMRHGQLHLLIALPPLQVLFFKTQLWAILPEGGVLWCLWCCNVDPCARYSGNSLIYLGIYIPCWNFFLLKYLLPTSALSSLWGKWFAVTACSVTPCHS